MQGRSRFSFVRRGSRLAGALVVSLLVAALVALVPAAPAHATFPSSQATDEGALVEFGTRYDATFTPIGNYYQVVALSDGAVLYSQNLPLWTNPATFYQDGPAGQFYTQDLSTGSNIVTGYSLSGGAFVPDFTFTAPAPTPQLGLLDSLVIGQWVDDNLFAFTRTYSDGFFSDSTTVFEFVDITDPANPVILPPQYPAGFDLDAGSDLKFFKDEKILYRTQDNTGVQSTLIYDIDQQQTVVVPVDATMYGPGNLQFSPDGTMLAFSELDQITQQTTLNVLDVSDPLQVTPLHTWTSDAFTTAFDWAPDSSGLIYQVPDQDNLQIDYHLDAFGASHILLYESASGDIPLSQLLSWVEDPRGSTAGSSTTVTNSGGDNITISTPAGTTISSATAIDPPPPTPAGVDFPFGLVDFTISGVAPGATIDVVIDLPSAPAAGWSFWKLQGGAYTDASSIASLSGSTLTLSLQDNGPFDADPAPGVIHDPGGVGVPAADVTPPDITITTPADGATYPAGTAVTADYDCTDAESGVATCDGDVSDGVTIDTSVVGNYTFTVDASDVAGNTASLTHTYTVADTTAPTSTATLGGTAGLDGWFTSAVTVDLTATDADSGVDSITYQATGAQTIAATVPGDTASPVISTDGLTTLTFSATDTAGNVEPTQAINVKVDSGAPTVGEPVVTPNPMAIGESAVISAQVSDATSGVWGAEWFLAAEDPDEGVGTQMSINSGVATATIGAGLEPGVHTVKVRAQDQAGNWSAPSETLLVVYDPEGGFVTGGGWIDSPEGALAADPDASGRANFGFVSKYKKGATVPTGQTEFRFVAGDLDFHSSSYDWLVVTQGGTRAQFKGSGTINGAGDYRFMIWATDDSPDTFRIRIWTEDGTGVEPTIYDNGTDNGTDQAIGGGNIVVHTKKK